MGAQKPQFWSAPRNQKNAISREPIELKSSFNDQKMPK